MKLTKTRKFRLEGLSEHEKYILKQTRRQFRKCVNYFLHQTGKKGSTKKSDYNEEYRKAEDKYILHSTLIYLARDFALKQYETYKNDQNTSEFPHFDSLIGVPYDNNSLSILSKENASGELVVSLATTQENVEATLKESENKLKEFLETRSQQINLSRQDDEFFLSVE